MERKAKEGGFVNRAPKGYDLVNKQLVINLSEAEQVKTIFKTYLESNISLTQLAKNFGLTTAGIIKLLKNKTYIGKVKFGDQESKGNQEPIIDEPLFLSVQNKLRK